MAYNNALSALADPTRQQIVERLHGHPQSVAELAQGFPVSRPAISQHLKVLSDAGLLAVSRQGARRIYRLDPGGVAGLRAWLDRMWGDALAAYAAEATRQANQRKGRPDD